MHLIQRLPISISRAEKQNKCRAVNILDSSQINTGPSPGPISIAGPSPSSGAKKGIWKLDPALPNKGKIPGLEGIPVKSQV